MYGRIALLFFLFVTITDTGLSQRVYLAEYESTADILVYYTDYRSQADLAVYFTSYESEARKEICDGIWYKSSFRSQADFTYTVTTYKSQADLMIYRALSRHPEHTSTKACDLFHSFYGR